MPRRDRGCTRSLRHRQRRRGEHRRVEVLEERVRRMSDTVIGVACRKTFCCMPAVPASPRRSIQNTVLRFWSSRMKPKLHAQLFHPARQRMNFVRLVGNGLQFGVQMQQGILQTEIFVAILFQKLGAVLEGEAALARRQRAQRRTASARRTDAARRQNIGRRDIRRGAACARHRAADSSTRRLETETPK